MKMDEIQTHEVPELCLRVATASSPLVVALKRERFANDLRRIKVYAVGKYSEAECMASDRAVPLYLQIHMAVNCSQTTNNQSPEWEKKIWKKAGSSFA
jgi:hypothetical protein